MWRKGYTVTFLATVEDSAPVPYPVPGPRARMLVVLLG